MNNVKLTTLENGMRVVTKSIENFNSVVLGYWVEAGGIYENENNCGVSHFLEHMAFKGTKVRTAKQIAEEIESVGGYTNAYTSKETTAFHAKVLKEDKKLAIDIVSDIIQNPIFAEDELERERSVILQEICQSQDTPDDIIFDHFQRVTFANQSMGMPILGPENIIKTMTSTDLRQYMDQYYNADNIVFSAVGNINHEEIIDIASEHFFNFNTKKTTKVIDQYQYTSGNYSDVRDLEQVHAIIGFNGVANMDDDYYTLAIFSSILGGGMSSKLFQEVREKRGLVYSIYTFTSSYRNSGLFGIYAATTSDKLQELTDVSSTELLAMRNNITEKEFNRTKAQFRSSLLMSYESNTSSCEQIVNQTIIFEKPMTHDEILAKIDSVTIESVMNLTDRILANPASVVTVGKCDCGCILEQLSKNGIK